MPATTTNKHETRPLIKKAVPDFANRTIMLEWSGGARTLADFSEIKEIGVFETFFTEPLFESVRITEGGLFLSWPNGIEYAAMSLWDSATPPGKKPRRISSHATPRSSLLFGD